MVMSSHTLIRERRRLRLPLRPLSVHTDPLRVLRDVTHLRLRDTLLQRAHFRRGRGKQKLPF